MRRCGLTTFCLPLTLQTVLHTFHTICEEINLKLHPVVGPASSLTALGFVISQGVIQHSTKFIDKMHHFVWENASLRDVSHALGLVIWTMFARQVPLAFCPHTLTCLRNLQRCIRSGTRWTDSCPTDLLTVALLDEFATITAAAHLPFTVRECRGDRWIEAHSDAAVEGTHCSWAWLSGDDIHQGVGEYHDIYIWELLAACHALTTIATRAPDAQTLLFVDNTAVVHSLRKGHSGNELADHIIAHLFSALPSTFTFAVAHTCSEHNFADPYTRGCTGSPLGNWSIITLG